MNWTKRDEKMRHAEHKITLEERSRTFQDFYATPAPITEALLEVEDFTGTIWEPACGKGHISEVLKAHKLDVYSSDIKDRGYGEVADFFDTVRDCDAVVTNPPYSDYHHIYFAAHALHVARTKVALLLPLTFLETPRRSRFLIDNPPKAVYVFSYRIWLLRQGFVVDGGSKWRRGAAEFGSAGLVKVSERQEWCVAEEV
jgi:hypothetical protein